MLKLAPEQWTMHGILQGFFIFGALFALIGLLWTAYTAWFIFTSEKTTGLIVDVIAIQSTRSPRESPHAKQVTSCYPVVEFRDARGIVHRSQSSRAARSDHFKRGDEAAIYYAAKDPTQMFIQNTWMLWFSPGVILAGGLIWMLFVGGVIMLMKRFE